ncbi:hypothetical protein [Asticcacaulis sp. AND118]|uniref:hypothetical protein n=1 Tax=Asticcacaulis sp. AND118 TaxID=2840468 RepID=UPI001CFF779A|nr:hypothetical protein [Asticcacaulis sp. AND118]UDF03302.1 hypothetical protein LH365_12800 [Asticcacaulis sp. AND118]
MMKFVLGTAATAAFLTLAVPAFAECDAQQERVVGQAIADAVKADAEGISGPVRKAVVDLDRCEGGSTHFDTQFKVKAALADGKVVWVEGHARGVNDTVESIHYRHASTELTELTRGTALASR